MKLFTISASPPSYPSMALFATAVLSGNEFLAINVPPTTPEVVPWMQIPIVELPAMNWLSRMMILSAADPTVIAAAQVPALYPELNVQPWKIEAVAFWVWIASP